MEVSPSSSPWKLNKQDNPISTKAPKKHKCSNGNFSWFEKKLHLKNIVKIWPENNGNDYTYQFSNASGQIETKNYTSVWKLTPISRKQRTEIEWKKLTSNCAKSGTSSSKSSMSFFNLPQQPQKQQQQQQHPQKKPVRQKQVQKAHWNHPEEKAMKVSMNSSPNCSAIFRPKEPYLS